MKKVINLYAHPRLKSPVMLATWPGIGSVSTIVALYLKKKLKFKELGEVDSAYFFDPIGVLVRDHIVEEPQFPQNWFYYLKNRGGANDIILFIGDDQPAMKTYELANCIVDLAIKLGVTRIYTCAAALTRIHHTEQPKVWGVATSPHLAPELARYDLIKGGNLQIAGLNGLLLGVAKEKAIEGICLLGEVPMYATRVQNPMAALAITKILTKILDVKIDLSELIYFARETQEKLKQVAAEAMGEYIDYFTAPIWEQSAEEEAPGEEEIEDEDGNGNGSED